MAITVPKKALENPDDGPDAVPPSEGDMVDLTVTAKVVADNGDTLDIEIETVGGEPVAGSEADTATADDGSDPADAQTVKSNSGNDAERIALMKKVAALDKQRGL